MFNYKFKTAFSSRAKEKNFCYLLVKVRNQFMMNLSYMNKFLDKLVVN